ncbi:hypothetical protein L1049_011874 [Liquidambar formosana]|uniref:KIB1-4 beta-propeller domain-containing protein n=1 Tax=Liquidambar formosana TaxID=63359 RepID=A0AAP0RXZ8_LIQFO
MFFDFAVCTSWRRSFIPPFGNISSPSFLKFSFPVPPTRQPFLRFCTGFTVSESTVYRLEPSLEIENPSSSSSSSKGWLVRLKEEEEPNKMRMLSPLADVPIESLPTSFPKILNLLDFRISEIHKSYRPQCLFLFQMAIFPPYVSKLAVLPSNAVPTPTDNYVFMMIYDRGRLRFMKSGDEEWTAIEEDCSNYSDVISYKGQFYAVNKTGRAVVVDRFLKVTEIASPLCDGGEG